MNEIYYSEDELKKLEGWRGLMSVLVFICHIFQIYWYAIIGTENLFCFINGIVANISVVCFFLLSGILITYSGVNLTKNNNFNWLKYLINRIARIYPSLICVMTISYLLILVFPYINNSSYDIIKLTTDNYIVREKYFCSLTDIIEALKMLPNNVIQVNGPLWSLVIEWWLYISGLFLFFIAATNFRLTLKNAMFFCFGLLPLYLLYKDYSFSYSYYCLIWFLGSLFTFYLKNKYRLLNYMFLVLFLGFLAVAFSLKISSIKEFQNNALIFGLFQIVVSLLFLKIMFRVNLHSVFNKIAGFSYTLYILHFPVVLFTYAVTKSYLNNQILYVFSISCILFFLILFLSKTIARFTEVRFFYQNILLKITEPFYTFIINRYDSLRKTKYNR